MPESISNSPPRNVRNFWVEVTIDGQTTKLCGGPVAKEGGISVRIHIRQDGKVIEDAMTVRGTAHPDGGLEIVASVQAVRHIGFMSKR